MHRRAWCQYMGCIVVASSTPISSLNLCRLHAGVSSLWHGPSDATAATWDKLRHMVKVIPNPCLGGTLVCLAFITPKSVCHVLLCKIIRLALAEL